MMRRFNGFEWACLSNKESGLPFDFWISSLGCEQKDPPYVRIGVDSGRLIPVSIDKVSPKILSARIAKKDREDVAKMAGFITAAYDILIAHWNKLLLSDREALGLLLKLAQCPSGRFASIRDREILVLCVGDGAVLAIDHENHQIQDADSAIWLGWNADVGSPSKGFLSCPEKWRREAGQSTEMITRDHKDTKFVVILAQMSGKPSTYMIPVSAKVFREHGIQTLCVITDDHHGMTEKQQEIIDREIGELRRQSDLLVLLPRTAARDTSFLLWQTARWLISGLKSSNTYVPHTDGDHDTFQVGAGRKGGFSDRLEPCGQDHLFQSRSAVK